jgi:hypothetical protein
MYPDVSMLVPMAASGVDIGFLLVQTFEGVVNQVLPAESQDMIG